MENETEDAMDLNDETVEQELFEHFRFEVDKGQTPLRIDKFLFDRIQHVSRNRIQEAAAAGTVLVNGQAVKANYRVKPGEVITIVMTYPPHEVVITPEPIPLHIVYEDPDLMVINKPAGLVVHPGHGNYHGTLLNALAYYFKDHPAFDANDPRLGLVHRIDKDTSGLLVIAKNETAKTKLAEQFFHKTTKRLYQALLWGVPDPNEGTIEGHIGRSAKDRQMMTVYPYGEHGKSAVTHYRVLESFGYVSLVECRLETGRTHQIRAHMKYIGHPLFNDQRYGGNEILRGTPFAKYKQFVHHCFEICPRQALHAKTLGFVHPRTGETLYFDSELPNDMQALIERWRGYVASRDGNHSTTN
ncbi:MAG: RluA family pseudouridine synthase [Microbacter sp.]